MNLITHEISEIYSAHSNPTKAAEMKAYLRNQFEFYGISSPNRRVLDKVFWKKNELPQIENVTKIVSECWESPEREMQYFAMEMVEKSHKIFTIETIELLENMIIQKSWWDTVDMIASHLVAKYFQQFPQQIQPITQKWMKSENMWLQRTCLIFQLLYKEKTDFTLLLSFIKQTCHSNEFFIQKAIGWALRQYARTNAEEVKIAVNQLTLKPLSKKEAMKHL